MAYASVNTPASYPLPAPSANSFQVTASAGVDAWRKPPSTDIFTAPVIYKSLPLSTLRRARITFSAPWATLYDQGGLMLVLPQSDTGGGNPKFVKTGIEFYDGRPQLSVVAVDRWADWSLAGGSSSVGKDADSSVTIELEREEIDGSPGPSLWIYHVTDDHGQKGKEVRNPLREVTWLFHDPDNKEAECWVGAFCAKPTATPGNPDQTLTVRVENFEIETR